MSEDRPLAFPTSQRSYKWLGNDRTSNMQKSRGARRMRNTIVKLNFGLTSANTQESNQTLTALYFSYLSLLNISSTSGLDFDDKLLVLEFWWAFKGWFTGCVDQRPDGEKRSNFSLHKQGTTGNDLNVPKPPSLGDGTRET